MNDQVDEHDLRDQIATLGRQVYGDDFGRFLDTPRRSLSWETPAALIERGDLAPVVAVLIKVVEGDFG
jgi:hypothetical protein